MSRRLLIVCGGGILSGKEIVSVTLAQELRGRGWDVEFLISGWGCAEFRDLLKANHFICHRLWLGFISASLRWSPIVMTLDQVRRWPQLAIGYKRLLHRRHPDLVIHTNWHHALLLAPFLKPARDVYWSHELLPNAPHYGAVFRFIGGRVARLICVSHAAARSLRRLGVPEYKVQVVHNGTPAACERGRHGGERLRLGIVGQVTSRKGHEDAVAAIAELARRGRDVELKIFGVGPDAFKEVLRHEIERLGIADRVEWCGFESDKSQIYSRMDVCLVPSRFEEPFATSALEAGGYGRPVVCTAVGGFPEIVRDGESGFLVPPGQPQQLADAIDAFIAEPGLVQRMGRAASVRVREEFSAAAFGNRFCSVLQNICARL